MRKRSLYIRMLLSFLVFAILGFLVIAWPGSNLMLRHLVEGKAEVLYKEANIIASQYVSGYYYSSRLTLEDLGSHLSALDAYLSAPIWVVNSRGEILLNSRQAVDPENRERIEGFDHTSTGNKYYQIGSFYGKFSEDTLSVTAPIASNYKIPGYVVIHCPMSWLRAERDGIMDKIQIIYIGIFLCSLVILLIFTFFVYIPLQKTARQAWEYTGGNFDREIPVLRNDEIGYLAASINYIANELNTLEGYQEKMIANISHDLRSPLTSIKGYVEAMLDGTIPADNQEKYLNIVLFETERLNKLASSLLTLNDFDARGALLDISEFDINATIKKTAAAFEGTCKQKKISIELILSGKTLYVTADMGKIQQVLYNLIDNAIKFSHNQSVISVETTEKGEKIFVSVKDTGIGIPKDCLKKIWERFYKTDLSRGKDKKGTGLGLSIVREILQSHNETIDVVSTEGVGTEFIFTLPRVRRG